MAIETIEQKLERVQAAIRKIEEGGQAYSSDGTQLTRADLKTLYEREKELLNEYYANLHGTTVLAGRPGAEKL